MTRSRSAFRPVLFTAGTPIEDGIVHYAVSGVGVFTLSYGARSREKDEDQVSITLGMWRPALGCPPRDLERQPVVYGVAAAGRYTVDRERITETLDEGWAR